MNRPPTFLTTRQLAESLGVSESSVKRWVDDGAIRAERTEGGHRRIPVAAAVRFIRSQRVRPSRPDLLSLAGIPDFGSVDEIAAEDLHRALRDDNAAAARAIIVGRYLSGSEVASIGDGLIRPVFERLGELWRDDDCGVLIEHRAMDTVVQALGEIASWLPKAPDDAPTAITCASPEDPYLLPPLLAHLTIRESGMRAWNLGAHTPLKTAALAIARYKAVLCGVSVSVEQPPPPRAAWLDLINAAEEHNCRVVAGGRCVLSAPADIRTRIHVAGAMCELAAYAKGLVQGAAMRARDASPPSRRA